MTWRIVEKLALRVVVAVLTLVLAHLEQTIAVVRAECQQVASRLSGW